MYKTGELFKINTLNCANYFIALKLSIKNINYGKIFIINQRSIKNGGR